MVYSYEMNKNTCRHTWGKETTERVEIDKVLGVSVGNMSVQHCEVCGERSLVLRRAQGMSEGIAVAIAESARQVGSAELAHIRGVLGLKRTQLADTLSVTKGTVSKWERGTLAMPGPAQVALKLLVLLRFGRKYRAVRIDGPSDKIVMWLIGEEWHHEIESSERVAGVERAAS